MVSWWRIARARPLLVFSSKDAKNKVANECLLHTMNTRITNTNVCMKTVFRITELHSVHLAESWCCNDYPTNTVAAATRLHNCITNRWTVLQSQAECEWGWNGQAGWLGRMEITLIRGCLDHQRCAPWICRRCPRAQRTDLSHPFELLSGAGINRCLGGLQKGSLHALKTRFRGTWSRPHALLQVVLVLELVAQLGQEAAEVPIAPVSTHFYRGGCELWIW
jgi:hypothetical protein